MNPFPANAHINNLNNQNFYRGEAPKESKKPHEKMEHDEEDRVDKNKIICTPRTKKNRKISRRIKIYICLLNRMS